MKQNQFSHETINKAINAIKGHESDIKEMQEKCAEMPLTEVAQTILIEKFGIAQIEAEEIVNDINKGITEFNNQFKANVSCGHVEAKEKLADLTKDMTEQERISRYVNILTALQLLKRGNFTEDEATKLLEANSTKTTETLAEEIEDLMNEGIDLNNLANTVKNGVNVEAVVEIAKQIELKKDDYRFMTALWLYIAQREGTIRLSDSEVPISAQLLGALSSAGIEAILVTAELEEGKVDLKRWQVIMKWILAALFFVAMILLLWGVIGAITFIISYLIMELIGVTVISAFIALTISFLIACYITEKISNWGFRAMEYLGEIYNKHIGPLTEKVKNIVAKIKEWTSKTVQTITNKCTKNSGNDTTVMQPQPVINNGEEAEEQPAMA